MGFYNGFEKFGDSKELKVDFYLKILHDILAHFSW